MDLTLCATLVLAVLPVRSTVLLLQPCALGLTLHVDGFEIRRIFRRERKHWWNVARFRVDHSDEVKFVRYHVMHSSDTPQRRRAQKDTSTLPPNYPLPLEDLA